MEIQKIITTLLHSRKDKVALLRDVQTNLTELQKQIVRLNKLAVDSTPEKSDFPREFIQAAHDIKEQIESIQKEVRRIDSTLKNLITRFENSTINIGVIGKAGQGKSTLL